jgi:demethoxyubiquinone hydroxylase (CLK1/Coq7/Cat5 family)
MDTKAEIKNKIIRALISENQAIGIYQAEVFWKKYPQETFRVILKDESNHFHELNKYLVKNAWTYSSWNQLKIYLYLISGWFIGTFLSFLPRKTCFHFHMVAEKKAANEYKMLMENLNKITGKDWKQSDQFNGLLKTMMNNEFIHSEIFLHHSFLHKK